MTALEENWRQVRNGLQNKSFVTKGQPKSWRNLHYLLIQANYPGFEIIMRSKVPLKTAEETLQLLSYDFCCACKKVFLCLQIWNYEEILL